MYELKISRSAAAFLTRTLNWSDPLLYCHVSVPFTGDLCLLCTRLTEFTCAYTCRLQCIMSVFFTDALILPRL